MCTPNQVAIEYEELVQLWERTVAPELGPLVGQAPPAWHGYTLTYLFDRFCHFIVVEIRANGWTKTFHPPRRRATARQRRGQFSSFLLNYLPNIAPGPDRDRRAQLEFARRLTHGPPLRDSEIKDFFLRLHAVKVGSGAGVRQWIVRKAKADRLRSLLQLLDPRNASLAAGVEQALTPPPSGHKIKYLGPSTISEIPGWLSVPGLRQLPIVNGRFVKTLVHLGLHDGTNSCFGSVSTA